MRRVFCGGLLLVLLAAPAVASAREVGTADLIARATERIEGDYEGPLARAGDVDGDGRQDLVIGRADDEPPGALVLLGGRSFRISGPPIGDFGGAGTTVSAAGDVNGDGLDDVVLTDPGGPSVTHRRRGFRVAVDGIAYVVFGSREPRDVDLSRLEGRGFVLRGLEDSPAAAAGDVDGDGFDDLVVGSGDGEGGRAYVVFGERTPPAGRDLVRLGAGGFAITPRVGDLTLGASVGGAGDVNGDGLDDVIIGAPSSVGKPIPRDLREPFGPGAAYVVFGKRDRAPVRLQAPGTTAIRIDAERFGFWGQSVAGVGDVNGDGLADVGVGGPFLPLFGAGRGAAAVVFGRRDPRDVQLERLAPDEGFRIEGARPGGGLGLRVLPAGDADGDGLADVAVVETGFSDIEEERDQPGRVHVVYGRREATPLRAASFGDAGLTLRGSGAEHAGRALATGTDLDADGLSELVVLGDRECVESGDDEPTARLHVVELGAAAAPPPAAGPDDLVGHDGPDELHGLAMDDVLTGRGGDDCLFGGDGADRVLGDTGRDGVYGEDGPDLVSGGAGADLLSGGAGEDRLRGQGGNDVMDGGPAYDLIEGGPGNDSMSGGDSEDQLLGDDGHDDLYAEGGADFVHAGPGRDQVSGGAGADRIDTGAGDDVVRAGTGGDLVTTGRGDDRVTVRDRHPDVVRCGPGRDRVFVDRRDRVSGCEVVTRRGHSR